MSEYTVLRTRYGAILNVGDYRLEATSPYLDHGAIRAALSVFNGRLVFRDKVNLTSSERRAKTLAALAEKQVVIPEDVLIALDEACRRKPPERDEQPTPDGGSDVSCKVECLGDLKRQFSEWLLIADDDYLAVLTAVVKAHELGYEPVWPLIVGPPGGTKTEPIRALYGHPKVYALSSLTPKTFASGLETAGDDPSLLARLHDEIIVLKDLTTILTMDRDGRQEVFGQLREIYGGAFDRAWGTGKELHWRGRLGFIGGVTDIIDQYHGALAVLGERFILFRIKSPDRKQLALKAMQNAGKEPRMRQELDGAMASFLASLPNDPPAIPEDMYERLATLADFVTRARSGVFRDGYKRELEYVPEPEAPTRFAKVLLALAAGLAVVHGRSTIGGDDLRIVHRVALDCIPTIRRRVIKALAKSVITGDDDGAINTTNIAGIAKFSSRAVRYALEDMNGLDLVVCEKGGKGKADLWRIAGDYREVFVAIEAASEGGSRQEPVDESEPDEFAPEDFEPDEFDDESVDSRSSGNNGNQAESNGAYQPEDDAPWDEVLTRDSLGVITSSDEAAVAGIDADTVKDRL